MISNPKIARAFKKRTSVRRNDDDSPASSFLRGVSHDHDVVVLGKIGTNHRPTRVRGLE